MSYNNNNNFSVVFPEWLDKSDNAWQMVAATMVGLQILPGLVLIYSGLSHPRWSLHSAFFVISSFALTVPVWILWAHRMSFGSRLLPFVGRPSPTLTVNFLTSRATLPSTVHYFQSNGEIETAAVEPHYPQASQVWYGMAFAGETAALVAGALLGRMSVKAWLLFVPLWVTFSYTVGAFTLWGGGFLFQWGVIDYCGGYVVHMAAGVAGYTAASWVGPRSKQDKDDSPPNNLLITLTGAGIMWLGWSGFNGGATYSANIVSSIAVLNTHICTATSLIVWICCDVAAFGKPSIVGVVQGMMSGLVCITPAAGLVQGWAAILMGIVSGSVPWYTMMCLSKKLVLLQKVDDTLGILHTHVLSGFLGGVMTGLFAHPELCNMFLPVTNSRGAFYGSPGGIQFLKQLAGACFVIGWNVMITTIIILSIRIFTPLRMTDEELLIGDTAIYGEVAFYSLAKPEEQSRSIQACVQMV